MVCEELEIIDGGCGHGWSKSSRGSFLGMGRLREKG